jgi:hypothetical protein
VVAALFCAWRVSNCFCVRGNGIVLVDPFVFQSIRTFLLITFSRLLIVIANQNVGAGRRSTHDAQACIEMRVESDALSAECPSGKSAMSSECPQMLKKFCALSTDCIGQSSSVLVSALIST